MEHESLVQELKTLNDSIGSYAYYIFGIKYADELNSISISKLVKDAGLTESMQKEIGKAKHVAEYIKTGKYGLLLLDSARQEKEYTKDELVAFYRDLVTSDYGTAGNAIFMVTYGKRVKELQLSAADIYKRANELYPGDTTKFRSQELSQAIKMYEYFEKHPNKMHLPGIPSAPVQKTSSLSNFFKHYNKYRFAIHTKPFLILGGFSGTGKSQKVKELAYLTCPKELQGGKTPGNYALISVKPNWHDSTELLGYESTISGKYMVTDFMRFIVKAMQHPNTPFFCCMDEMNLAHVEEYFAEYLSVLESRKKVYELDENGYNVLDGNGKKVSHIVSEPLVSADVFTKKYTEDIFEALGLKKYAPTNSQYQSGDDDPEFQLRDERIKPEDIITMLKTDGLCIPENLVVIGTVNMDDTTKSFSRKVIDRAMIFEADIEAFEVKKYFESEDSLRYGNINGKGFICDEVRADKAIEDGFELSDDEKLAFIDYMNELNKAMAGTSFQVSYRVLNEMILYYRSMKMLNDGVADIEQMKNDILMMKVLPRIEGDSAAKTALEGLKKLIERQQNFPFEWVNIKYNIDAETIASMTPTPWKESILKISYMLHLLESGDGFTRFWK